MTDKVEWELVDGERASGWQDTGSREAPPTPQQALRALLGRWWRWKILGVAVVVGLLLVLLATVAGVVVLVAASVAAVAIAAAKIRQLLNKSSGAVSRRGP
jgi:hypothetical protein